MELAARFRAERERHGLNLSDVADRMGIDAPALSRLETGKALNPTLANLTPAQTTCNYITLWFRNIASLLSDGDANGTWQRLQVS